MRAALRYRRGQAIALVLLSALVATCAAFAPTYARSVDQALLRSLVTSSDDAATTTRISQMRPESEPDVRPDELVAAIPAGLQAMSEEPIREIRIMTEVVPAKGKRASPVLLRSRSDVCAHLRVEGSCPERQDELVVSTRDAKQWGWRVGTTIDIEQSKYNRFDPDPPPIELRVVGTYVAEDDPGYWAGDRPDGKSGVPLPVGTETVPGVDDLLVSESTFYGRQATATVVVDLPLVRDRISLESLPEATRYVDEMGSRRPELVVDLPLTRQLAALETGRGQTAVIVPLVMTQLALLAALALYLVARGAVDQRRHDLALARLRGRSGGAARRLVLAELGTCALVGVPLGLVLGVLGAWLVAGLLLPDGVPVGVSPALAAWGLGALAVAIGAMVLATRGVHREPVAGLLRAARPRRSKGAGEVALGLVAVAGVVGVALGALTGPVTLATPVLTALAIGMLASALLPRVAAWLGERAARRGRVVPTLTAHGAGRRPGARRVLAAGTVGVAIAVFATTCVVVADGNRLARAELETGAPVVVEVSAAGPRQLIDLADAVREAGVPASPVATIEPTDPDASGTVAVDPATLPSVANPSAVHGLPLGDVATPSQQPIQLDGTTLTGTVAWDLQAPQGAGTASLRLEVMTADGEIRVRDLVPLDLGSDGRRSIDAPLLCPEGCRLSAVVVEWQQEPGSLDQTISGTITVSDLALDGRQVDLGTTDTWSAVRSAPTSETAAPRASDITAEAADGSRLAMQMSSSDGADVRLAVTDVPHPLPAIVTPGVAGEVDPDRITVLTPDGLQTDAVRRAEVPVLPRMTDRGVLVGLPTLARVGGGFEGRARAELWLSDTSPAALDTVRRVAEEEGIAVRETVTTAEAERAYDSSASGWGLRLAALAGGVGLLLAALVLVITPVTGWRRVVRDGAALLLSGVEERAVRAALVREQVVIALVAVALGTVAGLVGARIALPSVPLFVDGVLVPEPSTAIPWGPVALTVLASLVVLVGTALVVGRWLAGRTRPGAAQEVA